MTSYFSNSRGAQVPACLAAGAHGLDCVRRPLVSSVLPHRSMGWPKLVVSCKSAIRAQSVGGL